MRSVGKPHSHATPDTGPAPATDSQLLADQLLPDQELPDQELPLHDEPFQ